MALRAELATARASASAERFARKLRRVHAA
jgi:hypothetical protein